MDKMTKRQAEQILGLVGKYDKDTLNRAYRSLAAKYHPDVTGSDIDAAMLDVNTARSTLLRTFRSTARDTLICDADAAPAAKSTRLSDAGVDDIMSVVEKMRRAAELRDKKARRIARDREREAERERKRQEIRDEAHTKAEERYAHFSPSSRRRGLFGTRCGK